VKADPVTLAIENGYFQALPMLFSIFLKGGVTPTETTGGQGDYLWTFTPSLTASNAHDSISLQSGDDQQAFGLEYLLARKLKISGKFGQDQAVAIEAEAFAKQVSPITFTAAIAPFVATPMIANMTQIFLDPSWATKGTTKKSNLFRDFDIELTNGLHSKFNGDNLAMTGHGEGFLEVITTLTFENNADAITIWNNFRAQTSQALRIKIPGAQIGTGTNNDLAIDQWGNWEEVRPMDSEDEGDNLCVGVFHSILTPDAANMLAVVLTAAVGPGF
jgi:hypothetical protein